MISHNMTWIKYPSHSQDSNIEDIIFSQHVTSRLMHGYIALFVPTGLIAGITILGIFIKSYMQHTLKKLDIMIFAHTVSNIFMILLSLTIIPRPAYLRVSYLECGTLSFFFNLSYFNSQYLRVLMMLSFFFNKHPPQNAWISKAHQNTMLVEQFWQPPGGVCSVVKQFPSEADEDQASTCCIRIWKHYRHPEQISLLSLLHGNDLDGEGYKAWHPAFEDTL
ncbi:hypothetical protein JD844_020027 [Phrynosoma platyrhinos]|uniref:G-protein coupled receptors family 1 profile domain-containing protein n=1 Tax=Phrynosoma platyrhinos TaxID=52577 RepID=A0ABQ7TQE0_PHRPL|nr:hypothetical protein JD844_020027 [Phrynosoma platyrhinos]